MGARIVSSCPMPEATYTRLCTDMPRSSSSPFLGGLFPRLSSVIATPVGIAFGLVCSNVTIADPVGDRSIPIARFGRYCFAVGCCLESFTLFPDLLELVARLRHARLRLAIRDLLAAKDLHVARDD